MQNQSEGTWAERRERRVARRHDLEMLRDCAVKLEYVAGKDDDIVYQDQFSGDEEKRVDMDLRCYSGMEEELEAVIDENRRLFSQHFDVEPLELDEIPRSMYYREEHWKEDDLEPMEDEIPAAGFVLTFELMPPQEQIQAFLRKTYGAILEERGQSSAEDRGEIVDKVIAEMIAESNERILKCNPKCRLEPISNQAQLSGVNQARIGFGAAARSTGAASQVSIGNLGTEVHGIKRSNSSDDSRLSDGLSESRNNHTYAAKRPRVQEEQASKYLNTR